MLRFLFPTRSLFLYTSVHRSHDREYIPLKRGGKNKNHWLQQETLSSSVIVLWIDYHLPGLLQTFFCVSTLHLTTKCLLYDLSFGDHHSGDLSPNSLWCFNFKTCKRCGKHLHVYSVGAYALSLGSSCIHSWPSVSVISDSFLCLRLIANWVLDAFCLNFSGTGRGKVEERIHNLNGFYYCD